MKKNTSPKLSKRLMQYGALTAAISGISEANGQITYSGLVNQGGPSAYVTIDLDTDGSADFAIFHSAGNSLIMGADMSSNVNSMLGVGSVFDYPFALTSGVTISNNMSVLSNRLPASIANSGVWINNVFHRLNYNSCSNNYSQWCGVVDGFVGLRFNIGPDNHYGWARLDVANDVAATGNWILKDWAYNTVPDAPIMAGQTLSTTYEELASMIKIVALNKSIGLYNLPDMTSYKLFNMTGQEILNGEVNQRDYVIEANTVSSGIYLVELEDITTKSILRKKVVLQ